MKKSQYKVFGVSDENLNVVPINGAPLDGVEQLKYLGHLVTSGLKDNADNGEGGKSFIGQKS